MRTMHEFVRQCFEHNVHIRVFSITIKALNDIVLEFDSIRKISDGLRKSPGILPCVTSIPWLLYRAPPNEHQIHSVRFYSFTYEKRKHSLPSIFFDREAWIMASRNWEMLSVQQLLRVWKMHFT